MRSTKHGLVGPWLSREVLTDQGLPASANSILRENQGLQDGVLATLGVLLPTPTLWRTWRSEKQDVLMDVVSFPHGASLRCVESLGLGLEGWCVGHHTPVSEADICFCF